MATIASRARYSPTINVIDLCLIFPPKQAVAFRSAQRDRAGHVRIADNIELALQKCHAD